MTLTLLQRNIAWKQPEANRRSTEQAMLCAPQSDLYLLPEMWATGFATTPQGIAEEDGGESLAWMKHMAGRLDAAVAGSLVVRVGEGFRNRFYFVKPNGEVSHYDKHHLFTYGGEHRHFEAGDSRVVVAWRGVRFRLAVCYDLRFPTWLRNHEDYDALLCVASWPASRIDAWRTLLKARAIENQAYVCGVNRVGDDPTCHYAGASAFVDPYGHATECEGEQEASLTVVLDGGRLRSFREKFPVLKDRDIMM
ncbi:MAG: nitrilase family protein [Bacteroidales bacterium]|nr:nitrilase family protein [Candidatus Physcousia equi]